VSAFVINPYAFVSDNISEFSFLQATGDDANLTTYTFNNVNFGTADANRRIVIGVATRPGLAISSATIGGVSATILAESTSTVGGSTNLLAFISADVPTGSSGTVGVTLTAGAARMLIATYRVVSNSPLVLVDDDASASTGTSTSVSISTDNGIVLVGALRVANSTVSIDLSGIATEDVDQNLEGQIRVAFASERTTAVGTSSITASSANNNIMALGVCLK
jgi:hypothetical protein